MMSKAIYSLTKVIYEHLSLFLRCQIRCCAEGLNKDFALVSHVLQALDFTGMMIGW